VVDSREYVIFLDSDQHAPLLSILFTTDPSPPSAVYPTVQVSIGPVLSAPLVTDNSVIFHYDALTPSILHSVFSYAAVLNDCLPFGLHLRRSLSPLCVSCLRRVFRSLDFDFDSRVLFSDFSDFHSSVFGNRLSLSDCVSIFRIMTGADPRHPSQLLTASFTFDQFIEFAKYLVLQGDGPILFKLINASTFHRFLAPDRIYLFEGAPARELSRSCRAFVRELYQELNEVPSGEDVARLFDIQGEPPTRISNMRSFELSEWVRVWADWCASEPGQAARNLLAFGFPIEKVDEAFGIVAPPKTIPAVAIGGVGLVVLTASVAAMLYGRWAVRNKMWR
jgi:hypothetical protein